MVLVIVLIVATVLIVNCPNIQMAILHIAYNLFFRPADAKVLVNQEGK